MKKEWIKKYGEKKAIYRLTEEEKKTLKDASKLLLKLQDLSHGALDGYCTVSEAWEHWGLDYENLKQMANFLTEEVAGAEFISEHER